MTVHRKNRRPGHGPGITGRETLPKLCGTDIEVGNFIFGLEVESENGTGRAASSALLREIRGVPPGSWYTASCTCPPQSLCTCGYNPQDMGRKFLPSNGGCVYIDLNHLELCTPETASAFDHLACWHAMLRIARDALHAANEKLPAGQRIVVLVNNSDGKGNAYGSHVNFLLTRKAWENLFQRKLHHMVFLASYLASSILLTGAGKVGSENGRPEAGFQIAQRADFFECLCGQQTTYHRPMVNSRDESLAGNEKMARLHMIFFDNTLCHGSTLLKIGVTQIVLAMIEQEFLTDRFLLDDPVDAVVRWSHDPDLGETARLTSGKRYTALEMQRSFLARAQSFVAAGRAEGVVPRADEIMALWEDTLEKLEKSPEALASRLDWVLKRTLCERARAKHGLDWKAPEIKYIDHIYSSLDSNEGLYWFHERRGTVERFVSDGRIERSVHTPPEDSRAWTRALLLRKFGRTRVKSVDWDSVVFRTPISSFWVEHRTIRMSNPLAFTRGDARGLFKGVSSLDQVLDRLEAHELGTKQRGSLAAKRAGDQTVYTQAMKKQNERRAES